MKLDNLLPARFLDGPLAGQERQLPRGIETYDVGPPGCPFFVYEFAGKDGIGILMAKRGRSRHLRRLVLRYVGLKSQHPAVLAAQWRRVPYRKPKETR